MSTSFADLGVPARLVEALAADGITEAFPVQAATLPDALAGKDLCGRAPTGSGKTLGFGIPMMVRITQAQPTKPTGLVLVPTRELAEQVQRAFVPLGRAQWRFIQAIYGGASFGPQIHSLRKGASVVVATPGRLIDIIEKGYCDLSAVEVCVIDEADRMADLGFMPDVRKILDMTPATRQTMLWSATLDGDVNELIRDYMKDPVTHDLVGEEDDAHIDHRFVVTKPSERLDAAAALIEEHGPTIVFVKTRFGVDDVAEDLNRAGIRAGALHGARSQAVRQRTLEDFRRGKIQALVATDVAARGIHVDNVSLVVHYDMPDNDKDYTHRSGRTGRAGNAGIVIALVPPNRQRIAQRMSDSLSADVSWERGEKPIERVPAGERETGTRDRGDRGSYGGYGRDGGDRRDRDRAPRSDRPGRDRNVRNDRPPRDDNNWTPRPPRDNSNWTPRSPRDDNNWTPRPRRDDTTRDRNDWTPRPRRDDDRGTDRGRFNRDDRPRTGADRGDDRRTGGGYRGNDDRTRSDRPPFARDGQRPPYGRDGHNDRPWRTRDDSATDDRAREPGGYRGPSDGHRSHHKHTGKSGGFGGYRRTDGETSRPREGGEHAGARTNGSGYKASGYKSGGYKASGHNAGANTGGYKSGGYKSAAPKREGFRTAPSSPRRGRDD